jgi:transposase
VFGENTPYKEAHMLHFGADLHPASTTFTVKTAAGELLSQKRFPNDKKMLKSFVNQFPGPKRIAVEATGNWYWFVDLMQPIADEVCLVNPKKARDILKARAKTDKIDSDKLTELSRLDLLPTVYIPPKEIRTERELLRYRIFLVRRRTTFKNRVHSVLKKNGISHDFSDLFSRSGIDFVLSLRLNAVYAMVLKNSIEIIILLDQKIMEVEQVLFAKPPKKNSDIDLIDTLPGFGSFNSTLTAYEIGTIDRFDNHKQFISYAGLAPSTTQSGDKEHRHGKLSRQCNLWLKWTFIEASQNAKKHSWFNSLYQRVMRKHGKNVAKIAIARELAMITYHMLKGREPFRGRAEKRSRRGSISV